VFYYEIKFDTNIEIIYAVSLIKVKKNTDITDHYHY